MPPIRPWPERLAGLLAAAGHWARGHAAELLGGAVALVALLVRRRDVLDRLATLSFRLRFARDPKRCVLRALSLVELWAGRSRPAGLTLTRWHRPVARQAEGEPRDSLERLIGLADWAIHAPERPGRPPPAKDTEIAQTCRALVREWTLARFRATFPPRPREVATT